MIKELINFTNDLIQDIPDIMEWKIQPSKGLHIFVELNTEGKWHNKSPQWKIDYDFYDGKTEPIGLLLEFSKLEMYGNRIGTTMNKVLDKKSKYFRVLLIY